MGFLFKLLLMLALDIQLGFTQNLWELSKGLYSFHSQESYFLLQCAFWGCVIFLPDYLSSFLKPDLSLIMLLSQLENHDRCIDDEEYTDTQSEAMAWLERQGDRCEKWVLEVFGTGEDLIRERLNYLEYPDKLGDHRDKM